MKFSIVTSLIILAVGGAFGVMNHQKAAVVLDHKRQLAGQASQLGISAGDPDSSGENRITKRQRDERQNLGRAFAADLVAFAAELEQHEKAGKKDDAFDKRSLEMKTRLMNLDAAELKVVIANLRDDKSLSSEMRGNMIAFSILLLADDHPSTALALFSESSDLLSDGPMGRHVIDSSISNWAKQDPQAAAAWVAKNGRDNPNVDFDSAMSSIFAGAAEKDPKLAFKLIGDAKLEDSSSAIQSVVETCKTPQQRDAVLAALREYATTLPEGDERSDLVRESLENMGRNISDEKFDAVSGWISSAKLSQEETAQFAAGLSYFNTKEDTGLWIDWMAGHLPEDAVRDNVDNLIGQWTQQDYLAAGRWLTATPEGPAKQAAVSTYAGTVAEYEPQVAVQWADTLPDGPQRRETYQTILDNWPKKDAAGAAAFGSKHGIKPGQDEADSTKEDAVPGDDSKEEP